MRYLKNACAQFDDLADASASAAGDLQLLEVVFVNVFRQLQCLQCFDAVGWAAGRAFGL